MAALLVWPYIFCYNIMHINIPGYICSIPVPERQRIVWPDWSFALHTYIPPSDAIRFNNVKTCPCKISLLGVTVFSDQEYPESVENRRETVAFGSLVEQLKSILKPSWLIMVIFASLRNLRAPSPVQEQNVLDPLVYNKMFTYGRYFF